MPTQDEAMRLALENADNEPSILKTYWFPDVGELRLVHVDRETLSSDGEVRPFLFSADPPSVNFPSRIALILPDEDHLVRLPSGWGTWEDAVVIFDRNQAA